MLPQRPEFADFKSLFQSDDTLFGSSRRGPGSDGMTVKRTICDVNSFDCENSDSDSDEVFSGYKTPKVENSFDYISAPHTRGQSVNASRRISPSASGSLTPTSPTSVCDSAYVRVKLNHVADGEKEKEKERVKEIEKEIEMERSKRWNDEGNENDNDMIENENDFDIEKVNVNYGESNASLFDSNISNSNININMNNNNNINNDISRIDSSHIEPFGYNCDDNELNMNINNVMNKNKNIVSNPFFC